MSFPCQFTEFFSAPNTPGSAFQWEIEQNQDSNHLMQQNQDNNHRLQQNQVFSPQSEEQFPQPERIVPSQQREVLEHRQIQLLPMEANEGRTEFERDAGAIKAAMRTDATKRSKKASTSPPLRVSPTRTHTNYSMSHPYKRPQSSSGKQRRENEQHIRFVQPIMGSVASPLSRVTSHSSTGSTRCAVWFCRLVLSSLISYPDACQCP